MPRFNLSVRRKMRYQDDSLLALSSVSSDFDLLSLGNVSPPESYALVSGRGEEKTFDGLVPEEN